MRLGRGAGLTRRIRPSRCRSSLGTCGGRGTRMRVRVVGCLGSRRRRSGGVGGGGLGCLGGLEEGVRRIIIIIKEMGTNLGRGTGSCLEGDGGRESRVRQEQCRRSIRARECAGGRHVHKHHLRSAHLGMWESRVLDPSRLRQCLLRRGPDTGRPLYWKRYGRDLGCIGHDFGKKWGARESGRGVGLYLCGWVHTMRVAFSFVVVELGGLWRTRMASRRQSSFECGCHR